MKYRLKKDFILPSGDIIKKGTILNNSIRGNYYRTDGCDDLHYTLVQTNTEFFEPVDNRFRPEKGDMYWFIDGAGETRTMYWDLPDDKNLFDRGNVFETQKEAKEWSEKVKELLLSRFEEEDGA